MKIVNLTEFRAMPSGTLFAKYEPYVFGNLCIKGDTLSHDFVYTEAVTSFFAQDSSEWMELLDQSRKEGRDLPLTFEEFERDGLFEEGELFAVFSKEDVKTFIQTLQKTI